MFHNYVLITLSPLIYLKLVIVIINCFELFDAFILITVFDLKKKFNYTTIKTKKIS